MKISREVKVGILAIISLFILYFGFNFLKGVNIFSPVYTYVGKYANINGLTEQAPVYVRGYKVGQVDKIYYDFTQEQAFSILISVNKDIVLPQGTELALIADGLMGGMAMQLNIPTEDTTPYYSAGDTLPCVVVPGLFDVLEDGLLVSLNAAIVNIDSLVSGLQAQLGGNEIKNTLVSVERLTADLAVSSRELKNLMKDDVPTMIADAQVAVADIKTLTGNVKAVDLAATLAQVDTALYRINVFAEQLNNPSGTLGLLLNDKQLYEELNATVISADSLLTDLKANPERYVHFSVFGKKEKK